VVLNVTSVDSVYLTVVCTAAVCC